MNNREIRTAVLLILGLVLLLSGVITRLGSIVITVSPAVYIVVGIGMFSYGLYLTK